MGGESVYGEPFKDEIHSRLRFNKYARHKAGPLFKMKAGC
jgi:hypothetical protein